jgi:glycosyltransferase A (GT-A) superfamily protein (DUF2064 family)
MAKPDTHTAFLIFTRSEAEEARIKGMSNPRLFRAMNQRMLRLARRTGYPVVRITGPEQVGQTFGQRLTHAFQSVFDRGYERVIALGNDCLSLHLADLRAAIAALDHRPAVLGPDLAGGAYLIGLHRNAFQPGAFEALPWQQDGLWAALTHYCGTFHRLRPEGDANNEHALQRAIRRCRDLRFRKRLIRLLSHAPQAPEAPSFAPVLARWPSHLFFRGPPFGIA